MSFILYDCRLKLVLKKNRYPEITKNKGTAILAISSVMILLH